MSELITIISNKFHIPYEFIVVVKWNPKLSFSGVDLLSDAKCLDKKISKLKINDGVNLYFEDSWIPHPDLLDYSFLGDGSKKTKWETEFELEKNRFTIKYNMPTQEKD